MYNFVKINNMLTPNQSAFGKTTKITSLINCTGTEKLTKSNWNCWFFLIWSRHSILDQEIMFKKLNTVGAVDDSFASHLSNRKQYCSLGDQKSNESLVTWHFPRILSGPTLIHPVSKWFWKLPSKLGVYTIDTRKTLTSDSKEELLENAQEEMTNISEWMRINKLREHQSTKRRIHDNWAPTKNEQDIFPWAT